jgi:hypothetical protein
MPLTAGDVISKSTTLKRFWAKRETKFRDWYEQLQMVDLLAQRDMESFVGNDPRASFNLISSLLNRPIPHRLKPDYLGAEQIAPAAGLSLMFDTIWENVSDQYRKRGRDFQKDLIDFLLAVGWYSVFASVTLDGSACVAEVWNPATVFPKWSDMLYECAHIFTPGAAHIQLLRARNGWSLSSDPTDVTTVHDYWWVVQQRTHTQVYNAIAVGNDLVKPETLELRFRRIPIFTAPVGGLPDTGEMSRGRGRTEGWKGELGQSFISTNENVYKASNKWWTFIMQLLRDTAQAKTFERTSSARQIVNPETWYRRGAHYKLGLQDEVGYINPPPLPTELRSTQLDLEAMMQRGGPSWTMFGSIQAKMTAYAMSQVVATTNQVSRYYHQGVIDCISDIDNFWLGLIKEYKFRPYGLTLPDGLPTNAKIIADYELRIPGDMVQRATTARILNPSFELSEERIMEELFPEIKNPTEEIAHVRAGKARKHPVYAQLSLVQALREDAALLRDVHKDLEGADLLERTADKLEQSMVGGMEGESAPGERRAPGIRPEALPPAQAAQVPPGGR